MICQNCLKAGAENRDNHFKRATAWHNKCDRESAIEDLIHSVEWTIKKRLHKGQMELAFT